MRQIWVTTTGGPEVLKIKDGPSPIPRNGEVRIKVEASGINPADILSRKGRYPNAPPTPFVPGFEIAGTIDAVAQGVPGFREGDKVLAYTNFGGYSDLLCVPHWQAFKRLDWMSANDGAALLVDFLTAYVVLIVMGSIHKGNQVFIHNTADGLGLAVLEICRIFGARTYGTALSNTHDFLRERGLDFPIDLREQDYEEVIRDKTEGHGVDIVLARLGESNWRKSFQILAPTGRLIYLEATNLNNISRKSILHRLRSTLTRPTYTALSLMEDNKSVAGFNLASLWIQGEKVQEWMAQIISWYDEALFRPLIDKVFPFSQAAIAHQYVENNEHKGKVLLVQS